MTPLISIITIVKDNENYLPRAIESLLQQTLRDFELIVVNDGSKDNTGHVIDTYALEDGRIIAKHLIINVGRSHARNKGLLLARGKYIFFLDSDDYLPKDSLSKLYTIAEAKQADIVYGRVNCFNKHTGDWLKKHYTDEIINRERHNIHLDEHLPLVFNHTLGGRLFKNEMLSKNNIQFSFERKHGEDVLFSFYTTYYAKHISTVPKINAYCYSIGNYIDTANESKLCDARDNVIETINFTLKFGSDALKIMMLNKGAIFASKLERAYKVFNGNENDMLKYLPTMVPLVSGIPDEMINDLSGYIKRFTKALLAGNYSLALSEFKNQTDLHHTNMYEIKSNEEEELSENQIINLISFISRENIDLAHKLDALYNSSLWRITEPFRYLNRIYSKFISR